METSRGRKGRKASWHLTLGLKDTIFAGIGVVGLMMISFALGALAGRGDIYRAAYSMGLMSPDPKVAHYAVPALTPAAPSPDGGTAPAATPAVAPVAAAPANPAPAPAGVAAPPARHPGKAPVTGSIAEVPAASHGAKKKAKSGAGPRDRKDREEELHRLRQEVAQKLKFQNSFDTPPKSAKATAKPKAKDPTAKPAAAPSQVKVAQFRDAKDAKAKMAELQKKGIKASLKQSKDSRGTVYTVYRQGSAATQDKEKLARKPARNPENKAPTGSH